jgi:hypothetical protein
MDRYKSFGDAAGWSCAGWKTESRERDWYSFRRKEVVLVARKRLLYGSRLIREEMKYKSRKVA